MKNLIAGIFLLLTINLNAQQNEISSAVITDRKFKINSIQAPELNIDLQCALPEGFQLDDEDFFELNNGLVAILKSKKYNDLIDQNTVKVEVVPVADNSVRFIVTGFSQKLSELISKDDAGIYITVNKPIRFSAFNDNEQLKFQVDKVDVEKYTSNALVLTDAMQQELIAAKGGGIFMVSNSLDFGVIPSDDSENSKMEYFASFKYRKKYEFLQDMLLFFYGEGLFTTDSKDTLNYFSIYPINYNFSKSKSEIVGQIGVEGDQLLTNYKVSGNIYWQGILSNLIDLTFGEDRLRLKPVLKLGAKFYQEMGNNRIPIESDNEFSNQIFGQLYYYIPIKKNYSLILDGNAFYDFNKSVNADEELMFNYSITFGIEIPKTDFKTIFKIVRGENGITYQKDQLLMIGLMADLFSQK